MFDDPAHGVAQAARQLHGVKTELRDIRRLFISVLDQNRHGRNIGCCARQQFYFIIENLGCYFLYRVSANHHSCHLDFRSGHFLNTFLFLNILQKGSDHPFRFSAGGAFDVISLRFPALDHRPINDGADGAGARRLKALPMGIEITDAPVFQAAG